MCKYDMFDVVVVVLALGPLWWWRQNPKAKHQGPETSLSFVTFHDLLVAQQARLKLRGRNEP